MGDLINVDVEQLAANPVLMMLILFWLIWYLLRQVRILRSTSECDKRYMTKARMVSALVATLSSFISYNYLSLTMHAIAYENAHHIAVNPKIPGDELLIELASDPDQSQRLKLNSGLSTVRVLLNQNELDTNGLTSHLSNYLSSTNMNADYKKGAFVLFYSIPLANHGYSFSRPELQNAFLRFSWYRPSDSNIGEVKSQLNPAERTYCEILRDMFQKHYPNSSSDWTDRL